MNPQDRKPIPLTDEEKKNPISAFYFTEMAPPNAELTKILLSGPMDPKEAICPEQASRLAEPGYMNVETGYCTLENGAGYLCVNGKFPGVTLEMMKWWFAWHPLESLRYKIWNPYCHPYVAIADVDRAKITDPNVPLEEKSQDVIHFVVEDIGAGMQDIVIHFRPYTELGFTREALDAGHCYAFGGYGLVENREGPKTGKLPVIMLHVYREIEGGIESRTRFWMGYRIIQGHPVCVLPQGMRVPDVVPMGLALHNVEEFSHLGFILPKVYAKYGHLPIA